MYEVNCLDLYGNTIYNFFQWDVDQKIVVKVSGCDERYLDIAPEVHYCNVKSKDALVVRSVVSNHDTITAPVPNLLLQQPYPLLVYVYLTDSKDVSSQKTILHSEIPVRKRLKPNDYLYVENIERITAEQIKEEIEADINRIKYEAINTINSEKNEAIKYIDEGKKYITKIKDDAYTFITNTKDEAVNDIDGLKNDTINYISGKKLEFENIGKGIIADTQKIKDDTLGVYNDTVKVAGETANKIEDEIRKMMLENGMELKITDDGNGVCTMSIIVKS